VKEVAEIEGKVPGIWHADTVHHGLTSADKVNGQNTAETIAERTNWIADDKSIPSEMTKNLTHNRIGKAATVHQSKTIATALHDTKANQSNANVRLCGLTSVDCDKREN
jgi:hypothetical protein